MTRIGLFSLVDHLADPVTRRDTTAHQRLIEVIEQGVLAEDIGFERFAVGEHHFCRYILPNANLLLGAIAARTRRIRLFTTVTLLACRDPIQLAEDVAVLDNLSEGRIELTVARGVSSAASEVFGVTKENVYTLLDDKLGELLSILESGKVKSRCSPDAQFDLSPLPVQKPHPVVWIGGGLSLESCDLAVRRGLPFILPSLFCYPEDHLPMLERYGTQMRASGKGDRMRTALPSFCWVGKTSQEAKRHWRPRIEQYVNYARNLRTGLGREMTFDNLLRGPAVCGSAAEVVDRLSHINDLLRLDNHLLLMDAGGVPFSELQAALEVMGRDVLPHFRHGAEEAAKA